VGQPPHPTVPTPSGGGGGECLVGKVSVALTQSHSGAALTSNFSLVFFHSSCLPPPRFLTYFEVVQRVRPSYNPKGTCPRWARSPAAPGGTMRHTQQFLSTIIDCIHESIVLHFVAFSSKTVQDVIFNSCHNVFSGIMSKRSVGWDAQNCQMSNMMSNMYCFRPKWNICHVERNASFDDWRTRVFWSSVFYISC
jgi:hypothetical protein